MWQPDTPHQPLVAAGQTSMPLPAVPAPIGTATLHWCVLTALDVIGLPLVVVDAEGRMLHTNRSATRLLGQQAEHRIAAVNKAAPGLQWHITPQQTLALADAAQHKHWRQALRQAVVSQKCSLLTQSATPSEPEARTRPALPAEPSNAPSHAPSHAMVLPISSWGGQAPATASDAGCVLVLLAACAWPGDLSFQLFVSQHRLTETESRVLKQVCRGDSPRQIAQQHQVALSTITTQIASIRAKTGCRSLRSLAQWVSALPCIEPAGSWSRLC